MLRAARRICIIYLESSSAIGFIIEHNFHLFA